MYIFRLKLLSTNGNVCAIHLLFGCALFSSTFIRLFGREPNLPHLFQHITFECAPNGKKNKISHREGGAKMFLSIVLSSSFVDRCGYCSVCVHFSLHQIFIVRAQRTYNAYNQNVPSQCL